MKHDAGRLTRNQRVFWPIASSSLPPCSAIAREALLGGSVVESAAQAAGADGSKAAAHRCR